jgi:NlpE N-terminal domain
MPPFRSHPISCDRGWEWHLSSFGMMGHPLFSRCLLALCWLISAGGVTLFAAEREVSGVYQGHAPAADAAKRVFTLNLAPDGGATLTTLYIGKNDVNQQGHWTQNGTQVVLTFEPMGNNKPPRPITFRHHGHELSPIHWDPSEWGRSGPPILHRSRTVQGGV